LSEYGSVVVENRFLARMKGLMVGLEVRWSTVLEVVCLYLEGALVRNGVGFSVVRVVVLIMSVCVFGTFCLTRSL
jgi:hypothetical protein